MAIRPLLNFLDAAVGYIHPDPEAVEQTDDISAFQYHRKVVLAAAILGAIAAITGLVVAVTGGIEKDIRAVVLFPIAFGVIGIVIGVALACLVAPHTFLTGPVGQKWMKLIGTNSVTVARVVVATVIIAIVGVPLGLTAYAVFLRTP